MLFVTVDNRIRIPLAGLPEAAAADLRGRFTHPNPKASARRPDEPPTYRTWEHDRDGNLTLPRGGMQRAREWRRAHGLTWLVTDARIWANPEPGFPDYGRALWDHQVPMVEAGTRTENCLLRAPTGSGKTSVGIAILAALKRRALVMVWTANLLDQWVERAADELGLLPSRIGIIGDGKRTRGPLTVAMQQTVVAMGPEERAELDRTVDVVLCDEVQRFAAPTLFDAVDPFGARYRIGISADETRKDGKEFLTYDLFGRVAADVDEEALIGAGRVVEVEMAVIPTDFRAGWYRYRQDFNRLLAQMVADPVRNERILQLVRDVVGEGEQVLVFTHRVEHARDLDARLCGEGIRSGTLLGGADNAVSFDRTKAGLKAGSLRVGVGTYQAIAQGLDLPSVGRGICATPVANNRQQLGQVRGRICRASAGKGVGVLYVLWDRAVYGRRTLENLTAWQRVVRVEDGAGWTPAAEYLKSVRRTSAA